MHPLTWLILALWLTSLTFALSSFPVLIAFLCIALVLAIIAKGKAILVSLKTIRHIVPILLSVLVIQSIFLKGKTVAFDLGIFFIYQESILKGLIICLRLIIILFSAIALSSLSYPDYRQALIFLPEEIAFMLAYTVQLIPRLRQKFIHNMQMLTLRGLNLKDCGLRKRLLVFKIISLSVLAGLLETSSGQAIQLELRGFRRKGKKTQFSRKSLRLIDFTIYFTLIALSLIILLYLS